MSEVTLIHVYRNGHVVQDDNGDILQSPLHRSAIKDGLVKTIRITRIAGVLRYHESVMTDDQLIWEAVRRV